MKKIAIILGIVALSVSTFGQTIKTVNMSTMRARKAVDTLSLNDANLNTMPYLEMAFANEAVTVALTEDVWANVADSDSTLWTAVASGITEGGDTVTIVTAGDYVASVSLSWYATAADTIHLGLFKNGVIVTPTAREVSIGAEINSVSFPALFPNLVAGDDISIKMQNSNNGDDAIVIDGGMVLYMIRYD